MLSGKRITKKFGGLVALSNVDFDVGQGEIVGLVGPNGSGKTTLFNVISGFYTPESGTITFEGQTITGRQPHYIANLGIGRTFQLVRPFGGLTVTQNIVAGLLYGRDKIAMSEVEDKAVELLEFIGLAKKKAVTVADLTLAEKKRLEIGRALSTRPKLLLLDEVFAGLNPVEVGEAIDLVSRIRHELGITVFMIEHVMKAIMGTCERIIVLDYGLKIAEGKPEEVAKHPAVIQAYLGTTYA